MINQTFKYGVEIEFAGATIGDVVTHLRSRGLSVHDEYYNHEVRNHWKVITDGSVTEYGVGGQILGGELVSPILQGEAGAEDLRKVLEALNEVPNITVNRKCGLHVHLSWDGMNISQVKNIVRRYADYEDIIDSLMPHSRRGDMNRYCKTLKHSQVMRFVESYSGTDLMTLGYRVGDRFMKVNLVCLARHRTVEFRQHGGTLDYNKIINWVNFLMAFVEASKVPSPTLNFKRTKNQWYSEVREQLEAFGGKLDFKGRKWVVTAPSGRETVINHYSELDNMYVAGTKELNNNFLNFWNEIVGTTVDHVWNKVPAEVVAYMNNRIAELNA